MIGSGTSFSAGMVRLDQRGRVPVVRIQLTKAPCTQVAGLVAYKMTASRSEPGMMAMSMRTAVLGTGRMISPYAGPLVIWNGANRGKRLDKGNGSVSVF